MHYTITHNNTRVPLGSLKLKNLTRIRSNQACDRVTFTQSSKHVEDPSLFEPHQSVTLYQDNQPWFTGIITKIPGYATCKKEAQEYEISGPWWYLQNLVFQQNWNSGKEEALTPQHSGRVILGQAFEGFRLTVAEQLKEILKFAVDHDAPITIGTIDLFNTIPFDETKDISCADAIKRILRWTPDAVVSFDYSTPKPTINIQRRHQLQPINIDMKEKIQELKITPRHDLKVPSVCLKYEKQHTTNGTTWNTLHHDVYPAAATGTEFGALVMTIDLNSSQTQTIKQDVTTAQILIDNASWWKDHLPALHDIPANEIKINHTSRQTELPNELIAGSIAPWMNKQVKEEIIRAKISYSTESECIADQEVAIKILATDAQSQTYQHVTKADPGDDVPQGLARALFESVSGDVFEGKMTIQSEKVGRAPSNRTLNIFGGCKNWSTMNTLIQRIRENIDKGTITIEFGPARHLGVNDRIEYLRANKKRNPTQRTGLRSTGKLTSTPLEMSTHSRVENTSFGASKKSRMEISHPGNPGRKIVLDSSQLKEDQELCLREETVCENGEIKKRLVLATHPYATE